MAFPLYADAHRSITRLPAKVLVTHGDTDIGLSADAAPLQIVERPAENGVFLSIDGNPLHLLYPSYGIKYAREAGGDRNGYMVGQPVRTSIPHPGKVRKDKRSEDNCTWIKSVDADGRVCYKHYYAAVGGPSHDAIDLWLGVDEAGHVVLQAAPFAWRQAVEVADPVAVVESVEELRAALVARIAGASVAALRAALDALEQ
jgi:hypothetical protein